MFLHLMLPMFLKRQWWVKGNWGLPRRGYGEDSLVRTVCKIQQWPYAVCVQLHTIATVTKPLFMCPSSFCSLLGIWQRQTTMLEKWASGQYTNRLKEEEGEKGRESILVIEFFCFLFGYVLLFDALKWIWGQSRPESFGNFNYSWNETPIKLFNYSC